MYSFQYDPNTEGKSIIDKLEIESTFEGTKYYKVNNNMLVETNENNTITNEENNEINTNVNQTTSDNPATGDNIEILLIVFIISILGTIILIKNK